MVRAVRDAISAKLGVCPSALRAFGGAAAPLAAWALYGLGPGDGAAARTRRALWLWLVLLRRAWAIHACSIAATSRQRTWHGALARLHAVATHGFAREWNGRRLLSRREFVLSRVLGAGDRRPRRSRCSGHVPAQGGIIHCPGKFDMNRTESRPVIRMPMPDVSFKALADDICDARCATKICARRRDAIR
jgi:hypothetical protein